MSLKQPALFWRACSLGNRRAKAGGLCFLWCTQSPSSSPCPKAPEFRCTQLCHLSTREGRRADYIQPQLENAIFPRALLVWTRIKHDGRVYRVAGDQTLLEFVNSVFPPCRIPFLEILIHRLRGNYWTAIYIKSCPTLHWEGCKGENICLAYLPAKSSTGIWELKRDYLKQHIQYYLEWGWMPPKGWRGRQTNSKEDYSNQTWGWCEHNVGKATSCL